MAALGRVRLAAALATLTLLCVLSTTTFTVTDAFDFRDPSPIVIITWDVVDVTPDGFKARISINNTSPYRHLEAPASGWTLRWRWASKLEVIWSVVGGRVTKRGNCGNRLPTPISCERQPEFVNLVPGDAFNSKNGLQVPPHDSVATFEIIVGNTFSDVKSIRQRPPSNFTLSAPGAGYTCGPTQEREPTLLPTNGGQNSRSRALVTWKVTCSYSK